jgi:hypothetical protein
MSKKRKKEEAGKSTNVSHPSVTEGERKKGMRSRLSGRDYQDKWRAPHDT